MKTAVQLFLSSMLFGIVLAGLYWWSTGDIVGVMLLGLMALALVVIAVYIVVAEREARLDADDASKNPSDAAGETVGVFALESYWPIVAALATTGLVTSLVFLPGVSAVLLVGSAGILVAALRYLAREST